CSAPATPCTVPLSLHDALPIYPCRRSVNCRRHVLARCAETPGRGKFLDYVPQLRSSGAPLCTLCVFLCLWRDAGGSFDASRSSEDRKSTRLNSSHVKISYAVFC